MTAAEIKSDTLTLLLTNAIHRDKEPEQRAKAIRKCAKVICNRTNDKALKNACRMIRNEKNDQLVSKCLDTAEIKYFMEY
jgi:hypothetical protein